MYISNSHPYVSSLQSNNKIAFSLKQYIRDWFINAKKKLIQTFAILKRFQKLSMDSRYSPIKLKNIWLTLLFNIIFSWFLLGFFIIPEHTEGVVTRFKQYNRTVGTGIHWHMRFIEQIFKVNVGVQKLTCNTPLFFVKDAKSVCAVIKVEYTIKDSKRFFFTMKEPIKYLKDIVLDHFCEEVLHYTSTDLSNRALLYSIQANLTKKIQATMNIGKMGIETLETVEIWVPTPHIFENKELVTELKKATRKSQQLEHEAKLQTHQIEENTALDIQKLYEKAYTRRQSVLMKARSDTDHFLKLLPYYKKSPQLTMQRLRIQMLEKVVRKNRIQQ